MEKTITIDEKTSFKADNSLAWMMIYKSQFGHDIIPEMMPFLGALSELVSGLAAEGLEIKDTQDLMQRLDKETLTNSLQESNSCHSSIFAGLWLNAQIRKSRSLSDGSNNSRHSLLIS